jgi:hypothetical protein
MVIQLGAKSSAGLKFSATVLNWLPFSISGERSRNSKHRFEIKRVEEKTIYPDDDYILNSVHRDNVLKELARRHYQKRVFMIVGVRVGYDAHIIDQENCETKGRMGGTVPGSAIGVPVDIDGQVYGSAAKPYYQEQDYKDPFVFAYRLREIRYFPADKTARQFNFTRGADLHDNEVLISTEIVATALEEVYIGRKEEIVLEGIDDEDFDDGIEIIDGCVLT